MTQLPRAMAGYLLALFLLGACRPPSEPAPTSPELEITHWAKEPMLQNPVAISHDPQGRLYATESNRRRRSDLDVRFMRGLEPLPWPVLDYTIQSVENRRDVLKSYLGSNSPYNNPWLEDYNGNGSADWRDLLEYSERVNRLADTDGDGVADEAVVFADNFNTEVTGTAGGVLWHDGQVYFTVIPDLWKLVDTDEDGIADEREVLHTGHGVHIGQGGHDLHGLTMGPDGRLYWSIGDKGINIVSHEGTRFFYPNQGVVMRSEPDGSRFEVFAHGLRNCQEIEFDDFGNLFCMDNDGDFPQERERLVYVTEGSDTGWRINWQYDHSRTWAESHLMPSYHPWLDESLAVPHFDGQAAYITPPLANYSDGPAGFKRNPGTALSDRYSDYFFLTHFPGQLITAFQLKPQGASFEMANEHAFHQGFMATGLSFGPDGALYVADWSGAWAPTNEGGIFRIDVPAAQAQAERQETQQLIEEGMEGRTVPDLVAFLHHKDRRVRQEAQFALVNRLAEADLTHLAYQQSADVRARTHAIWGLGQLTRNNASVLSRPIQELLADPEAEIRAQACRLITEAPHLYPNVADNLVSLLSDASERVQFHAAMALADVGNEASFTPLVEFLARHNDQKPFLRHAGVSALVGMQVRNELVALATDERRAVKRAAVVALRRLQAPEVAVFLDDEDELVVLEAARAIHDDLSIPDALPALADLLNARSFLEEGIVRRVLNAHVRLGRLTDAEALLAYAGTPTQPPVLREEALNILHTWPSPPTLDRVERRARIFTERSEEDIAGLISAQRDDLFAITNPTVLEAALRIGERYEIRPSDPQLLAWVADSAMATPIRVRALGWLAENEAQLDQALSSAFSSSNSLLRNEALAIQAGVHPETALSHIETLFADTLALMERQQGVRVLGMMEDERSLILLSEFTSKLLSNNSLDSLALDVFLAARSRELPAADSLLASLDGDEAPYRYSRFGGDAARGAEVFAQHAGAMCSRCHALDGAGSNVGPNLSGIGSRLSIDELLDALIEPNAQIASGWAMVTLTMNDGQTLSGTIIEENNDEIVIQPLMSSPSTIEKSAIQTRTTLATSIMPAQGAILSATELRDVMAYLASL